MMKVIRNTCLSLVPQLVVALVSLGTLRVYTHLLTLEELGYVMLSLSGLSLIQMFFSASGAQVVFFYASRVGPINVLNRCRTLRNFIFFLALGALLVSAALIFQSVFAPPKIQLATLFFLAPLILVDIARASMQSLLNLSQRKLHFGALIILDATTMLGFVYFGLLQYPNSTGLLLGVIASKSVGCLVSEMSVRMLAWPQSSERFEQNFTELLRYSIPFALMGILGWSTSNLDRFIVNYAAGPSITGIYALVASLVARPYTIATAALTVHFRPHLFSSVCDETDTFRKASFAWLVSALVIGSVGSILFLLFGDLIATLLFPNRSAEVKPLLLFIFAISFSLTLASHALENRYLARGENTLLLRIQTAYVPIAIFIIYACTIQWGISGAVASRIISEMMRIFILTRFEHHNPR
jgi:O-antigen/teichoic acid export membrane protein